MYIFRESFLLAFVFVFSLRVLRETIAWYFLIGKNRCSFTHIHNIFIDNSAWIYLRNRSQHYTTFISRGALGQMGSIYYSCTPAVNYPCIQPNVPQHTMYICTLRSFALHPTSPPTLRSFSIVRTESYPRWCQLNHPPSAVPTGSTTAKCLIFVHAHQSKNNPNTVGIKWRSTSGFSFSNKTSRTEQNTSVVASIEIGDKRETPFGACQNAVQLPCSFVANNIQIIKKNTPFVSNSLFLHMLSLRSDLETSRRLIPAVQSARGFPFPRV